MEKISIHGAYPPAISYSEMENHQFDSIRGSLSPSLSLYIYTLYTVIGRNCTRMMASMRGIIPFYGLVSPLRGGRPKGRSVALFHLFSGPRSVNCYNYI